MKYKVTKTTTEEIDIDFPLYNKSGGIYIETASEDKQIVVHLFSFENTIEIKNGTNAANMRYAAEYEICTEQEFNQAYDKALRILLNNRPLKRLAKNEKVFDIPTNDRYENIPAL